ncbi:c-type cytochrome [Phenylobacterium montanum]|uniref:Cytochrome c family protein n=1 Tax=Phenylobacterium montanum TaxID=2823693 RepID=A0A975FXD2_9CAUL|nr:cytochrome c family protein [Caulobacter sp. S6]QUD87040.1 cytochrome c family protein [Caulobacter sp. S6]
MSDSLGFNKIAGALLATGLVIIGLGVGTKILFEYKAPAKEGYAIAVQEESAGGGAAVEQPIDWGTELPKADVAAGKAVAAKCQSCHNLDQGGPNQTGPNLWGVLGRQPGSHPGFAYSDGMKAFGAKQPTWDYVHINDFITAPGKYIDGTKMTFVGLKQRQDRINIIAYLHTLGSNLPIPAPNPAAAAAPAAASGAPASGAPAAASAAASAAPEKGAPAEKAAAAK